MRVNKERWKKRLTPTSTKGMCVSPSLIPSRVLIWLTTTWNAAPVVKPFTMESDRYLVTTPKCKTANNICMTPTMSASVVVMSILASTGSFDRKFFDASGTLDIVVAAEWPLIDEAVLLRPLADESLGYKTPLYLSNDEYTIKLTIAYVPSLIYDMQMFYTNRKLINIHTNYKYPSIDASMFRIERREWRWKKIHTSRLLPVYQPLMHRPYLHLVLIFKISSRGRIFPMAKYSRLIYWILIKTNVFLSLPNTSNHWKKKKKDL